jgi:pimeloyl-ACP methyl ester carboxylesterase
MASGMRIVILPGLDGTGLLLRPFVGALKALNYDVDIITYPPDEMLGYEALLGHVRQRLPSQDFLLVGESFSGPLAIRLAREGHPFLRAVVLGASFARLDLPFKTVVATLVDLVPARAVPLALLNALLLNGRASDAERVLLGEVLRSVDPKVLALRAKEALRVDAATGDRRLAQPLLYLRASRDRLMRASAAKAVAAISSDFTLRDIPAPHFLFQTRPLDCAAALAAFDASRHRAAG